MQYKILQAKDEKELEKKVNDAIKDGWKPQGGVSVSLVAVGGFLGLTADGIGIAMQAMVKESQSETKQ